MKRKLVFVLATIMTLSMVACGEKDRYGEDANFNDPSIYDSSEADKEIAGWIMNDQSISLNMDKIEFEVDGQKLVFPACASDVIEGENYIDFNDRMYPSGGEFTNISTANTECCQVYIHVDNNSGKDLYPGEMACYKLCVRPNDRSYDKFKINILGVEINKDTTKEDVKNVLGEPDYLDNSGDIFYYFNKGAVEFNITSEGFEDIWFYAPGWR